MDIWQLPPTPKDCVHNGWEKFDCGRSMAVLESFKCVVVVAKGTSWIGDEVALTFDLALLLPHFE